MSDNTPGKTTGGSGKKPVQSREDRLKAALKSNLARRKAQTRAKHQARGADAADQTGETEE